MASLSSVIIGSPIVIVNPCHPHAPPLSQKHLAAYINRFIPLIFIVL